MALKAELHIADYMIFAFVLLFSVGIGLYFAFTGGRQRTTKEYLVANRKLSILPVALSMFMSYTSAIYILGSTAETYLYGVQTWTSMIGHILGSIIVIQIFIPLFYPLKLTSAFEYVDKRFKSRPLRVAMAVALMLSSCTYMGIAIYAPGTALEAVTGFPLWAIILITIVVVTFYTTLGGMKAVVWTDVFQGLVYMFGLLVVLIMGAIKVGGIAKAWNIANDAGRINFFNFDPDPTTRMTFWPLVFGHMFNMVAWAGTAQAYVQRYCALPTIGDAKKALYWTIVFYVILSIILCFLGIILFAYYQEQGCDPLRSGQISNANQLLPYFVLHVLKQPGLTGLFISILFSGALSSVSSVLSSLSAVTWKDILEQHLHHLSERRKALVTKIIVFFFGCVGLGIAFLINILSGHVMVISSRLGGSLGSPIKGIMIIGFMFPGAEWIGAFVGSVASLLVTNWMNVGAYLTVPHREFLYTTVSNCTFIGNATARPMPVNPKGIFWLYRVSFLWVGVIGTFVVIIVGMIVSKLIRYIKREEPDRDPSLFLPFCDQLCCCLPKLLRKYFWFGVNFDKLKEMEESGALQRTTAEMKGDIKKPLEMDIVPRNEYKAGYHKIPLTGQAAGIYDVPNGDTLQENLDIQED